MKKLIFFFVFLPLACANSDEPSFSLSVLSNINNLPIQIEKSSENIKTPFSLEFKKWTLSPSVQSYVRNKSLPNMKNKSSSDILFVKFKYIF